MINIANTASNANHQQSQTVVGGFTFFRIFLCVLTGWFSYVAAVNLLIASQQPQNWVNPMAFQMDHSGSPNLASAAAILNGPRTQSPTPQATVAVLAPNKIR